MRVTIFGTVAFLGCASLASAQSFNIDFGSSTSAAGVALPTYGAAAGQMGTWNAIGVATGAVAINDLSGAATAATVTSAPFATSFNFAFNNAATLAPDQALLDDLVCLGNGVGGTITFSGLIDGNYDIYLYAWAPDVPTFVSIISSTGLPTVNVGGAAWSGAHVAGNTYALYAGTAISGGTITFNFAQGTANGFVSCNGAQFVKLPDPPSFPTFCFGDGGDQLGCTDCPCTNNAPLGSGGGCLNSNGTSARLVASGTPDVTTPADTLHFDVLGANASTFGILTSGDNRLPNNPANVCFAQNPGSGVQSPGILDGLRCIGGNVVRHGSRSSDVNGDIGITTNGWGPPNNPLAGIGVTSGFIAGQTRHFQVFYRESATAQCMTGQNTTQGVTVTFL